MYHFELNGITVTINATSGLFSPSSLDPGTRAMLKHTPLLPGDKLLDLGCGAGPVGVYAARLIGADRVWMTDSDPEAVRISGENAAQNGVPAVKILQSDGFRNLTEKDFTVILSNPPYHTDFSVAKHFIEKGFNRLTIGGRMVMVTKRLDWYKNKLSGVFGGVRVLEADGYYVLTAEKRSADYAKKKPR